MPALFGLTLTQQLGLNVFFFSIMLAGFLYWFNRTNRVNLSLPFGNASIPYAVAVLGGAIFAFAYQGIVGIASSLATAIFFAFLTSEVIPRLKQSK